MARSNTPKFDPSDYSPAQIATAFLVLVGLVLVIYVAWSGCYTVKEYEQAVVLRFGEYNRTVGPGLQFKFPGMEERILVDVSEKSMRLPMGNAEVVSNPSGFQYDNDDDDQSLILTGDLYAAIVEWNVFWRVSEPKKFIFSFNEDHVQRALIAVSRSTMHRIVGDYSADEILTGKREEIALAALKEMKKAIEPFDAGIDITDLQLQRVTPPEVVKPSFDLVNASIQQRDQLVNEARRERNQLIPMARAQSDKLIREAEGYGARRLAEAEGEITALLAKYESYRLAPEVTRQRMYLETMEKVFSADGKKIILDESLKGMLPLLDLNK
ncbi:MAG: FtsH protease activity modulator HflK [Pirellulaceae bacterium]|nr:FtsH protease activity modulator HflK [Pirellulaceae bacterium]